MVKRVITGIRRTDLQYAPGLNPQPFWNTENPLPMRDILQHFGQQLFAIFNPPFLMTGRTELPAFARKFQEILMAAFFTADPG